MSGIILTHLYLIPKQCFILDENLHLVNEAKEREFK